MFDVVIINDDLERAYEELKEILDEVRDTGRFTPGRVNQRVTNPPASPPVRDSFLSSSSGNQKSSGSQIISGRAGWVGGCREEPTFVSRSGPGSFCWPGGGPRPPLRANLERLFSHKDV